MTTAKWWPKALLLVLALLVWRWHDAGQRAQGALREQIKAGEAVIASLAGRAHVVDTTYVHDTVTFARFRTRFDTMLVDRRITDTVWVKAFVLTADSTVRACSVALETCARRVDIRDSIIAATNDLLRLERKRRPSRLGCVLGPTVTQKGFGLGGSCGLRIK